MLRLFIFLMSFLWSASALSASTVEFEARFTGVVTNAEFGSPILLDPCCDPIDLSGFTSDELGYDDTFFYGLDRGERVRGTIRLSVISSDPFGTVQIAGDCFFTSIAANFCGDFGASATGDFDQTITIDFDEFGTQQLTLNPVAPRRGTGTFFYEDASSCGGVLPDGRPWECDAAAGFRTTVTFRYQVVGPNGVSVVPLPASGLLLLSVFAVPLARRLRTRHA